MTLQSDGEQFIFVEALSSARSGDSEGFDRLYLRFARDIYLLGLLECFLKPDALVESVLSQVFAELGDFVGSEPNFAGLLFSKAMSEILAERKAHGLEAEDHVRCSVTNFDQVIESDRLLQLHDAIHWLSAIERRTLHLRLTFGLNLLQAARVLELPLVEFRLLQNRIEAKLTANLPEVPPLPDVAHAAPPAEFSLPL